LYLSQKSPSQEACSWNDIDFAKNLHAVRMALNGNKARGYFFEKNTSFAECATVFRQRLPFRLTELRLTELQSCRMEKRHSLVTQCGFMQGCAVLQKSVFLYLIFFAE
jgi:hypothetical protein